MWSALLTATGLREAMETTAIALGLNFAHEGDRYRGRQAIAAIVGALDRAAKLHRTRPHLQPRKRVLGQGIKP